MIIVLGYHIEGSKQSNDDQTWKRKRSRPAASKRHQLPPTENTGIMDMNSNSTKI